MGTIATNKLNPHPKNNYYFTDVTGEKYEEIKRSIENHGIRDPIKVTTSYTVISGHQRLRIAKELGIQEVPVEIVDVDEWQAEYLLIAENVERRGQAETDPIKKARIAQFLKEYWGVRDGRPNKLGQNGTVSDIADTIGETERTTKRILKLNDLIPEIQQLVSENKLGTTAAEQLAYLSEDEQRALLSVKGSLEGTTVTQAKEYRKIEKEAIEEGVDFSEKLKQLEQSLKQAEQEKQKLAQLLTEERNKPPKVETRTVEKIVDKTDYDTINKLNKELEEVSRKKELLEKKIKLEEKDATEYRRLKDEIKRLHSEKSDLHRQIESATSLSALYAEIEHFLQKKLAPIKYSRALTERRDSKVAMDNLKSIITVVQGWVDEMRTYLPNEKKNIIDVEVIDEEEIKELELKEKKLKHETHISSFELQLKIQKFIKEAAPSIYLQGAIAYSDIFVKKELMESVKALEDFTDQLKRILGGKALDRNVKDVIDMNDIINLNIKN